MDFFEYTLSQLIPPVGAQTLDGISQPTFGPLDIGTSSGQVANVTLTASDTSVEVGDTFDLDIEINSANTSIIEYRVVIDYNITRLSVVDADNTLAGTQIEFLDTVFSTENGKNNVSPTGRIELIAKTPSGTALQVNRKVAKVTFQAQETGDTTVSGVQGTQGSQLINTNGVGINSSINTVTVTISTQSTDNTGGGNTGGGNTGGGNNNGGGNTGNPTPTPTVIPDTGLAEDIAAALPIMIGIFLISVGLVLTKSKKDEQSE